jgi:transcriptional regulator with XRE-family HTH domain
LTSVDRRAELKSLLKAARANLSPEAVGLRPIGRRRVAGLRREEVAELAGLNPAYYTRFERGERTISLRAFQRVLACLRVTDELAREMVRLAFPDFSALTSPALASCGGGLHEIQVVRRVFGELVSASTVAEARLCAIRGIVDAADSVRLAYWCQEEDNLDFTYPVSLGPAAFAFDNYRQQHAVHAHIPRSQLLYEPVCEENLQESPSEEFRERVGRLRTRSYRAMSVQGIFSDVYCAIGYARAEAGAFSEIESLTLALIADFVRAVLTEARFGEGRSATRQIGG